MVDDRIFGIANPKKDAVASSVDLEKYHVKDKKASAASTANIAATLCGLVWHVASPKVNSLRAATWRENMLQQATQFVLWIAVGREARGTC